MIPALVSMDAGTVALIILVVIIAIIAIIGFSLVGMYNGLVGMRNRVQESWNQVDVELQRRHDLIPQLVNTVKGMAGHERNTLEEIVRLRNQAVGANTTPGVGPSPQQAAAEEQLTQAVHNMIVTVEAYPDLKSNTGFQSLMQELSETEDRIAAGRRFYNANVRAYNTKVESFPSNILAGMFKFEKATYFEVTNVEVRQAQEVDFSDIGTVGPTQSQVQAQQGGQPALNAPSYQDAYPQMPGQNQQQTGPFAGQPQQGTGAPTGQQWPQQGQNNPGQGYQNPPQN